MMQQLVKSLMIVVLVCAGTTFSHASVDFQKEILPVLQKKCWNCHQAPREEGGKVIKPKGELRLDADWAILKGGKSGSPAVTPKDPAKSYLLEVVTLPKEDDMFMPPKGEPLTGQEIARVRQWIEEGANFGGWRGSVEGRPAEMNAGEEAAREREHQLLFARLSQGLEPLDAKVLKSLKENIGAQVVSLGAQTPLVRVDFLTGVKKCTDETVSKLAGIGSHIAQLDLARTRISNEALKSAAALPRLVRLDLRHTEIDDEGLRNLAACKELRSINLFSTRISDAGLEALANIKSLREVYVMQTRVTEQGVTKLRKALPEAEVVAGDLEKLMESQKNRPRTATEE